MNGQYPEGGPKTAVTRNKMKFTQLTYQLCQLPTLILSHRVADADALADIRRTSKKLIADLLGEAHVTAGPHTTHPYEFDRLTTQILQVRLDTTVIGPHRVVVRILYNEAFAPRPKEVLLELAPELYFKTVIG